MKKTINYQMAKKSQKGFTLIEILVAMAIVAVLASVVIFSSASTFRRSRDTQRKSDLKNITDALELFYNDHGVYPPSLSSGLISACPYNIGSPLNSSNCTWGVSAITDDNNEVYMSQVPEDPQSNTRYIYVYLVSPSRDQFKIFTILENPEDPDISSIAEGQGVDCIVGGALNRCNYAVSSSNTQIDATW